MVSNRPQLSTTSNDSSQFTGDRVLRFDEVRMKTGLCRSHIHQLISRQQFPRQLKLVPGGRASGWLESQVNQWIADRVAERDKGSAAA
jgi:prophage regulatory protein